MNDPLAEQTVPTRRQALRVAKMMGCSGAHQHDNGGWMPCASHEAMMDLIQNGKQKKTANVTRTFVDCGCGCKGAGDCGDTKKVKTERVYLTSSHDGDADEKGGANYYARDGDLDGLVQDGTPNERQSRGLGHRRIGKKKRRVLIASRLQDFPFPYAEEMARREAAAEAEMLTPKL